jgi:hypothetical protein
MTEKGVPQMALDPQWERNRAAEVQIDLLANWMRILPCFLLSLVAIGFLCFWKNPISYFLIAAVAMFYIAFVASRIIIWLRLWGAYIERRIEEIEAKLDGREPEFYCSRSPAAEQNGLHKRFSDLEQLLANLKDR